MKKETTYLVLLTAIFFVVSFFGILHHELWLDEAHHYLLARDSNSFLELIQNTRYEGHPILWNLLLYVLTRFTLNPFWMQFLHILISTSVVYIFLRKAPFSLVFKILFIFGYFMIFEYNLISRNYILGVLFLFLACTIFEKRKEKFLLLCIYLALAANIHLMFSVIAFAIFLTLLLENYLDKELFKKLYCIGYLIFGFGILLTIIQIIPPDDTRFFERIDDMSFDEKFIKGFVSLFKAIVTIPDFRTIHFWNSNLLVNLSKPFSAVLGLLTYCIPLLLFYKNRKTLFFVYIGLIGVQVFFFVTQISATRYDGMNYLIIIIGMWMEHFYPSEDYKIRDYLSSLKLTLLKNPILYSILIIQFFSGIYAYAVDYKYQFTSSKKAIDYLKDNKLNNNKIITITCDGTAISPYLKKKVYFLSEGSYQSYCYWNFDNVLNISEKDISEMLTNYIDSNDYAIYVSNYPITKSLKQNIWEKINEKVKIRFIKKYDQNIVRNSYYYIYEVSKI
ncbi:hypothetical protein [Flavobacterium capsici]|uniref:Uncharacterized protein n=1 Tax=Flavobacterium capsici TaxID=3075618 RepID=A0AA96F1B3_9FLAO|nr:MULTISPECIES: hypothetical protein [unclassified Flavobacterium]WNM19370.1 hypothetical protein RN608_01505 [Flavobacterium sp. PMR2A8]WNM20759.1 hypothetical protein RN605_08675 [Flavobacterium sp. PMTSA4]